MCGINGFIRLGEKSDRGADSMRSCVHTMNERIVHRGPDSEGLYADEFCALGMRRLSIIDLDGGSQPIWNGDATKCIVFNGELYNYRELRAKFAGKGWKFRTATDTEVVLAGFDLYGEDIFDQLEGMFAFCIYDRLKKTWLLARDRIGEKPLYYYRDRDKFLFASELKSLLATNLVEKRIRAGALSTYLQLTYIPAEETILEGVYKLPAASCLTLNADGEMNVRKYWKLDLTREEDSDYETCKRKLREALYASVEKRMISDVPLGTFLSGGIDSTIITGIAADISNQPINTFTVGFKEKEFDESGLAAISAKRHGTNHHMVILDWDKCLEDLDGLLGNIDEPFADSSLIATHAVSKAAKRYVTVALTGDAGDELFAGYDKYLISYYGDAYNRIPRFLRKGLIEPGVRLLPAESGLRRKAGKVIRSAGQSDFERRRQLMCLGFKDDEMPRLARTWTGSSLDFIRDCYTEYAAVDEQKRAQYVDLNIVLEGDMLAKVDRASMFASLETRTPMLDRNVVELAFRMPTNFKIAGKRRKIILKDAFRDLIPEELFTAPKRGFGVPVGSWLRNELRGNLTEYADKEFLEAQGLFNAEYVSGLIEAHMQRRENRYGELWTFYVFQNWYKRMMA